MREKSKPFRSLTVDTTNSNCNGTTTTTTTTTTTLSIAVQKSEPLSTSTSSSSSSASSSSSSSLHSDHITSPSQNVPGFFFQQLIIQQQNKQNKKRSSTSSDNSLQPPMTKFTRRTANLYKTETGANSASKSGGEESDYHPSELDEEDKSLGEESMNEDEDSTPSTSYLRGKRRQNHHLNNHKQQDQLATSVNDDSSVEKTEEEREEQSLSSVQKQILRALRANGGSAHLTTIQAFLSDKWKKLRKRDGSRYTYDHKRVIAASLSNTSSINPLFQRDTDRGDGWWMIGPRGKTIELADETDDDDKKTEDDETSNESNPTDIKDEVSTGSNNSKEDMDEGTTTTTTTKVKIESSSPTSSTTTTTTTTATTNTTTATSGGSNSSSGNEQEEQEMKIDSSTTPSAAVASSSSTPLRQKISILPLSRKKRTVQQAKQELSPPDTPTIATKEETSTESIEVNSGEVSNSSNNTPNVNNNNSANSNNNNNSNNNTTTNGNGGNGNTHTPIRRKYSRKRKQTGDEASDTTSPPLSIEDEKMIADDANSPTSTTNTTTESAAAVKNEISDTEPTKPIPQCKRGAKKGKQSPELENSGTPTRPTRGGRRKKPFKLQPSDDEDDTNPPSDESNDEATMSDDSDSSSDENGLIDGPTHVLDLAAMALQENGGSCALTDIVEYIKQFLITLHCTINESEKLEKIKRSKVLPELDELYLCDMVEKGMVDYPTRFQRDSKQQTNWHILKSSKCLTLRSSTRTNLSPPFRPQTRKSKNQPPPPPRTLSRTVRNAAK